MTIIYPDSEPPPAYPIKLDQVDPHKHWLRHYYNLLYLEFIERKGTFQEKRQANKEIKICQRKLAFWERHPSFAPDTILADKNKLRRDWELPPV